MAPGCSAISPPMKRAAGLDGQLPSATPSTELGDVIGIEAADGDVVEEEERLGALAGDVVERTWRNQMQTPIVSNRPVAWAISALVPTPSVEETSTGWR